MSTHQEPRVMCVACGAVEVSEFDLLCPACHQLAFQAGLIPPPAEARDQRNQIGPTDV